MKVGIATVTGIASDSVSPDNTVEAKNSIVYEYLHDVGGLRVEGGESRVCGGGGTGRDVPVGASDSGDQRGGRHEDLGFGVWGWEIEGWG